MRVRAEVSFGRIGRAIGELLAEAIGLPEAEQPRLAFDLIAER